MDTSISKTNILEALVLERFFIYPKLDLLPFISHSMC